MQAVDATGYNGPLSLEIFNDQFRAQSTREVAIDAMRSLVLMGSEQRRPTRPCAPARSVSDTHFIEFAVDQTHAAPLAKLLRELGFRLTGRHRSKAVERWSQGDINLLINTSDNSFARSHYLTHGSGVCAIALQVDDVAGMMSRAEALQATTFRQAGRARRNDHSRDPRRRRQPAVFPRAGLAQLGHRLRCRRRRRRPGFLHHIDHISQSMRFEEMLSWEQFYTGLFDVQRAPQLEIADPLGLVKSQVLQNKDGSLRLVLNASTATQTMSSRFLSEFFGAGVQHIAFACDDIFKAVSAMRAAGATFLTIPDNYYDDIDSRYELDPALAESDEGQRHPLRSRRCRRILPDLHPRLRGTVLLRDRATARIQGFRRAERRHPSRGADAGSRPRTMPRIG